CSPTCTPSRARPERLVVNAYRCSSSGLCSTGAALGSTGAALCSTGATLCSTGAALCSTGAALGSTGSLTLPPPFAATTPAPENTPGFAVAAIGGLPWFALARKAGLPRAACTCCCCAAVGERCCTCAAANSTAVGWASTPPLPPL